MKTSAINLIKNACGAGAGENFPESVNFILILAIEFNKSI